MKFQDRLTGALAGFSIGGDSIKEVADIAIEKSNVKEADGSLSEVELFFDSQGWTDMYGSLSRWNFTRSALRKITNIARVMYLINPLVKRAVTVQELYVWGRGVSITSKDPDVQEVLNDVFKHPKNQRAVGEAWPEREQEQRVDGNTTFVWYKNKRNGSARVRAVPFDVVADIHHNPEDQDEPWYYKMAWAPTDGMSLGLSGEQPTSTDPIWIPDADYNPKKKPAQLDGIPIKWDRCVMHNRSGHLPHMRFGVSELLSVMGWATSYKKVLDNFATILNAYARMAMKMTGLPGKKGTAAAKSKINTGVSSGRTSDNNPPPNTASWFFASGNVDIAPIKTAHSTTAPDEARALRSMVAAGTDIPEHFFGDSDIGGYATSDTLDRPTELKMILRQTFWANIILRMCRKAVEWSVRAPEGKLRKAGYKAAVGYDDFDGSETVIITDGEGNPVDISVDFPNILERDVTDRVRSVVMAATLGGSPAEGIIPDRKLLFKLLMIALGEKDAIKLMDEYYPESVPQGFADPADRMGDEHLAAQGKKELGDAALQQAAAAKIAAKKPVANKTGSPASGGSSRT